MYTRNAHRLLHLQRIKTLNFQQSISIPCKTTSLLINNLKSPHTLSTIRWNRSINERETEIDVRGMGRKAYYNPRKRKTVVGDRYKRVNEELFNEVQRLEKEVNHFISNYNDNGSNEERASEERRLHGLLYHYTEIFKKKKQQLHESTFEIVESDYVKDEFHFPAEVYEMASVSIDRLAHMLLDREEKMFSGNREIKGRKVKNHNKLQYLNSAIINWSHGGMEKHVDKILHLLDRMEYIENISRGQSQVCPTTLTYNTAIAAILKCHLATPPQRRNIPKMWNCADDLFQKMKKSPARKRPDKYTYHNIMNFYINSKPWGDSKVGIHTENYLQELQEIYDKTLKAMHAPCKHTYGIAMYAHVRSGRVDRAENLLRKLEGLYNRTKDELYRPNMVIFGTVVSGWARQHGNMDAANHANRTLHWMIQSYHDGNTEAAPSWVIFNHVMDAYCKLKRPKCAESVLKLMEQEYFAGNSNAKPNTRTFGILINAWAKQKSIYGVQKALEKLDSMRRMGVEPNEVIYNTILDGISNSGDPNAGPKAETILQEMHHLYNTNQNKHVKPDAKSYTCVMSAWLRTEPRNADQKHHIITKIGDILKQMEYISSNKIEDADIAPDLYNYNILLLALSQYGQDGEFMCQRALDVIEHVEDQYYNHGSEKLVPTDYLFNSALNVIAKSKKPGSSKLLFKVLQKFEQVATKVNPAFLPCAITHSIILEGLRKDPTMSCKDETVDAAEGILNETIQRYRDGNATFTPKLVMFDQVIMLICNSQIPNKTERAWKILQLLKQTQEEFSLHHLTPQSHTYNWILTAATKEKVKKNHHLHALSILEVATNIYTEMKETEHLSPEPRTYSNLLKVAGQFIYNEVLKRRVIEDIFVRCCVDGMFDKGVLKTLYHCNPGIFYERALDENGERYRPFIDDGNGYPEEWMRNVELKFRPDPPKDSSHV